MKQNNTTKKLALAGVLTALAIVGCCGLVYKKCHILSLTCLAEAIGTGFLGALAAYPVALYLMGIAPAGLFVYVVPFLISTVAGSILAFILITVLEKGGVMSQIKEA